MAIMRSPRQPDHVDAFVKPDRNYSCDMRGTERQVTYTTAARNIGSRKS
jgi:hypothetical protein